MALNINVRFDAGLSCDLMHDVHHTTCSPISRVIDRLSLDVAAGRADDDALLEQGAQDADGNDRDDQRGGR